MVRISGSLTDRAGWAVALACTTTSSTPRTWRSPTCTTTLFGETFHAVVPPAHCGSSRPCDECGRVRNTDHRPNSHAADFGLTDDRIDAPSRDLCGGGEPDHAVGFAASVRKRQPQARFRVHPRQLGPLDGPICR